MVSDIIKDLSRSSKFKIYNLSLSHQKFTADDLLMISELLNHADNL